MYPGNAKKVWRFQKYKNFNLTIICKFYRKISEVKYELMVTKIWLNGNLMLIEWLCLPLSHLSRHFSTIQVNTQHWYVHFKNTLRNIGHLYVLFHLINLTSSLMLWSNYYLWGYILFIQFHWMMTPSNIMHLCKHLKWYAFFSKQINCYSDSSMI